MFLEQGPGRRIAIGIGRCVVTATGGHRRTPDEQVAGKTWYSSFFSWNLTEISVRSQLVTGLFRQYFLSPNVEAGFRGRADANNHPDHCRRTLVRRGVCRATREAVRLRRGERAAGVPRRRTRQSRPRFLTRG